MGSPFDAPSSPLGAHLVAEPLLEQLVLGALPVELRARRREDDLLFLHHVKTTLMTSCKFSVAPPKASPRPPRGSWRRLRRLGRWLLGRWFARRLVGHRCCRARREGQLHELRGQPSRGESTRPLAALESPARLSEAQSPWRGPLLVLLWLGGMLAQNESSRGLRASSRRASRAHSVHRLPALPALPDPHWWLLDSFRAA